MKVEFLIFATLLTYATSTFAQIEEVKETKEKVQIKVPPPPKKKKTFKLPYLDHYRFRSVACEQLEKSQRDLCRQQAFLNYIYYNVAYPLEALSDNLEGKVMIEFKVKRNGVVKEGKILKDIGSGCGQEVLRVINLMPDWLPANSRGSAGTITYRFSVTFKLD